MNCGFSDLFCCIRPMACATFFISKIEHSSRPYADVFVQVDKTFILDSDYLVINKPGEIASNQKYSIFRIFISKEPGNLSGVSRVTFPDDSETFIISYIRCVNNKKTVLGEHLVTICQELRECTSTDDTEDYSPMFRPSLTKKFMMK